MPATETANDIATFVGYVPNYYPANLAEQELHEVEVWARHCRMHEPRAVLLAAYLHALVSFERERRAAIEDGNEIVEVHMPAMPAHAWDGPELAAALGKLAAITSSTDGEVHKVFDKLFKAALAETQYRLGLRN